MNVADKNTFPYIKALEINDCYAYQNLSVVINDDESVPFKHLILTGKNGSGKTTTLNFLYENLKEIVQDRIDVLRQIQQIRNNRYNNFEEVEGEYHKKNDKSIAPVFPIFSKNIDFYIKKKIQNPVLLTHFLARRTVDLESVKTITNTSLIINLVKEDKETAFRQKLKQYFVNKKVSQVFAQIDKDIEKFNNIEKFFIDLEYIFQMVFEDENIKLVFDEKVFELYVKNANNQLIDFNHLSDGFSSYLDIIFDLLTRVDIIREDIRDYTYNPCGFVLIDEPEIHLHLELQYQVLPILTKLFPNLQFIVATHSPAVISSIKDATVYDLSTQKTVADWIVGSSYSELMMKHFGLENEFSNIADEIIETTQNLVDDKQLSPQIKFEQLKKLFDDNQKYLSPSLRLSLEVQVLKLEKQLLTSSING